jgi:hypothetical protein
LALNQLHQDIAIMNKNATILDSKVMKKKNGNTKKSGK